MFGMGTGVSLAPWAPKPGFQTLDPIIHSIGGPKPRFDVHFGASVLQMTQKEHTDTLSKIDDGDKHQLLVKSTSSPLLTL